MAIADFGCKDTANFFESGRASRKSGWAQVSKIAKRKLDMLDYATCLNDLRQPPANRLESLKGTLQGYYSIRINDQWRIIFQWSEKGLANVQIVDYH